LEVAKAGQRLDFGVQAANRDENQGPLGSVAAA
jgi:hypothetical protein